MGGIDLTQIKIMSQFHPKGMRKNTKSYLIQDFELKAPKYEI